MLLATLWLPIKANKTDNQMIISLILYREWDLNPHSHFWPKDFKSFVSTDSTITACFLKSAAKVVYFFQIHNYCPIFYLKIPSHHALRTPHPALRTLTTLVYPQIYPRLPPHVSFSSVGSHDPSSSCAPQG